MDEESEKTEELRLATEADRETTLELRLTIELTAVSSVAPSELTSRPSTSPVVTIFPDMSITTGVLKIASPVMPSNILIPLLVEDEGPLTSPMPELSSTYFLVAASWSAPGAARFTILNPPASNWTSIGFLTSPLPPELSSTYFLVAASWSDVGARRFTILNPLASRVDSIGFVTRPIRLSSTYFLVAASLSKNGVGKLVI